MIRTPLQAVHDVCLEAFIKTLPDFPDLDPIVRPASKDLFGDYQCNGIMRCAKLMKRPPLEIAEAVLKNLDKTMFSAISIAGAGFINLTLSDDYIINTLLKYRDYLKKGSLISRPQKIIVEYSSPNIAKDMHVGHLRSTIIGDSLAKIFQFLGHDVLTLNHLGDWGTSFGLLISYMKEYPEDKSDTVSDLTVLYKKAKIKFDNDEDFKNKARRSVVALQNGDPEIISLWKKIYDISRDSFDAVYSLLNISIQERGESFYNPLLKPLLEDLESKGLLTLSDGAQCIFIEGLPIPLMVRKQDGGFNYDTTDMAAMRHRVEKEKAERIIIVTDSGQDLHFKLIREASEKAGYLHHEVRFDHVTFGLVLDAEGKKFKTRSGETIKLMDLLETSISKAGTLIEDKNPNFPKNELQKTAEILGINAVKYSDLSCNRVHDYVFSFEKMLRFEGKTATFILYAYVRIQGIKRKLGLTKEVLTQIQEQNSLCLTNPAERALGAHLIRFPDILLKTAEDLLPHYLADYLYETAEKFNIFFKDSRISDSEYKESRLRLCLITEKILETGMHLLGLRTTSRL